MLNKLLFPFVWLMKKSKNLSAVSCRLIQLTGKSKYPIHPKHLINNNDLWYQNEIKKNDIVLDLGCGNGMHSIKIAKTCKEIIAIDSDIRQLEIGEYLSKEQNINNIKFIQNNLENKLPFNNNYFDKILCLDVLEHLYNREMCLLEIKRVLKPNGIVFISVPNKNTSWKKLQRKMGLNYFSDPDHKIEYSLQEIQQQLTNMGFKIVKLEGIVLDTPMSGFIDLIGGFSLNLYKKISIWKRNSVKNSIKESIGFRIKIKKYIFASVPNGLKCKA